MPDKTILIVDDTPANIAAALAILKDQYRTRVATSGAKALNKPVRPTSRTSFCST